MTNAFDETKNNSYESDTDESMPELEDPEPSLNQINGISLNGPIIMDIRNGTITVSYLPIGHSDADVSYHTRQNYYNHDNHDYNSMESGDQSLLETLRQSRLNNYERPTIMPITTSEHDRYYRGMAILERYNRRAGHTTIDIDIGDSYNNDDVESLEYMEAKDRNNN